jgi:peptidoglycan/LPS O-acetylase OafA/YrhL
VTIASGEIRREGNESPSRDPFGGRIPTLDGWRAVAILAVIVSHSAHLIGPGGPFPAPPLDSVFAWFRLGVDLFFAISGFLITTLLVRERLDHGALSLRGFYTRRLFRIVPLVATYLLSLAIIRLRVPGVARTWEFSSTLLLCRNYFMNRQIGVATAHLWSLSIEEHFYLVWPLVIALLGPRRGLRVAVVAALLVAVWRAVDARTALFLRVFGVDPGALFRTDTRCDALLWGAAAGLITPSLAPLATRWRRIPWSLLVLTTLVIWIHSWLPLLSTVFAVAFPLLVLSTTLRPGCATSRFLDTGVLRWIGQRSYSMYIWQTLFLQVPQVSLSCSGTGRPVAVAARYGLDLCLIVIASAITHRLIERPAQRYGRRLALQIRRPAAL